MKDAKGHGSDSRGASAAPQTPTHQTGVNNIPKAESNDSRELRVFGDNDSNLNRQSFEPVVNNLQKKMDKGNYDPAKAATLWGYHADRAAQSYAKQFGSPGQKWHEMFPPAVRREAASNWESEHRDALSRGEYRK